MNKSIVSIITVCRDAFPGLRRTADSVYSQRTEMLEWIIVDGDSKDGTIGFLEGLREPWIRWISEADNGIYDAMNKGLRMARGEWVWFMNAGDTFHDETAVEKVLAAPGPVDICFGEVLVEDAGGSILGRRSEITPHHLPVTLQRDQFRLGMIVSHQAFVPRRAISPMYRSDRYKYSADLDWMLETLKGCRSSLHLGDLARIQREGATMNHWRVSQWERYRILCRHFGTIRSTSDHLKIASRRIVHAFRTGYWR